MQDAAFVARIFNIDPIAVLDSAPAVWELRLAAAKAAVTQMRQEVGDDGN